jgi:DNA-binding LacI/PurR family transcriptional regulator
MVDPDMGMTMKDIAKEAGVSITAVSKALNNKDGISLGMRQKIRKIAERIGYSPYIKARRFGMYTGQSRNIAIILAFADEYLTRNIQKGIDSVLTDSNFAQLRFNVNAPGQVTTESRMEFFIDKISQDKSIAGLMCVFLAISHATIASLKQAGIPVVLLNNPATYGMSVDIDNTDAAYQATKSLIELGRKKIGLIMPEETNEGIWRRRLDGYRKALEEANLGYDPILLGYEHSFSLKESALATRALLERNKGMDAILYGSDVQAYGGLEALKELNIRIPDDIAVMGFDNLPFSAISDPPLSSVDQPMLELGQRAAEMLVKSIETKSYRTKSLVLKTRLILRQSSHKDVPREKLLY